MGPDVEMDNNSFSTARYSRPGTLMHVYLVLKKNVLLKARGLKALALEMLLPTFFVLCLIPGWLAAGSDNHAAESYYTEAADIEAELEPLKCLKSPVQGLNYRECTAPLEDFNCIGELCMEIPSNNKSVIGAALAPLLLTRAATVLPSFDTIALVRKFAQVNDLPGVSTFSVNVATALSTGHKVAIVPGKQLSNHSLVDAAREYFEANTYTYSHIKMTFDSEKAATDYTGSWDGSKTMWGLVVVNGEADYDIRMNRTSTPTTQFGRSKDNGWDDSFQMYMSGGFVTLQTMMNRHITGYAPINSPVSPMPIEAYKQDNFLSAAGTFLPIVLTLAFLFPMAQMVSGIVREKEQRIREGMLIMGLGSAAFKLSWVLTTLLQMSLTGLFLAVTVSASFLNDTSFFIVFFLFFFYCLSLAAFAILLSVFFSKASLAVIVSPMVFLATAIPAFVMSADSTSAGTKSMLSIFSTYAFGQGVSVLAERASAGDPVTLSTAGQDDYSYNTAIGYLVFDVVSYLLLALYFDAVIPSEWGAKKPFYFPCWPPLWFKRKSTYEDLDAIDGMIDRSNLEKVTDPVLVGNEKVQVTNLRKEFKIEGTPKVACNNINLTMYEGQILALLGHNGAGKTTLINMLTGMLPVSRGDATVYGSSIHHNLGSVRQDIGLCPQHNILWDNLTCAEHLRFYAGLKGVPRSSMEQTVTSMLKKVELADKADVYSAALSGGMKRKLSVAISLIGGSRFIILDEPTAGMDVQARRAVWDLLKTMRTGRTILLTTHFMDEADLLGDTIAIMHAGRVNCCGSPFFLKQKLGVGYNLKMEIEPHGDANAITDLITKTLTEVKEASDTQQVELLSAAGTELSYRVPAWGVPAFEHLFECFEERGEKLGVSNFGMSVTTLEEVFIKIAHDQDAEAHDHQSEVRPDANTRLLTSNKDHLQSYDGKDEAQQLIDDITIERSEMLADKALLKSQLKSLFLKRYQYSKRDKCTICFQLILPVLLIAFTFALTAIPIKDLPSLKLTQYKDDSLFPIGASNNTNANQFLGNVMPGITPQPVAAASAAEMNDYLLSTYDHHGDDDRWQALVQPVGATVSDPVNVFFNVSYTHSLPICLNAIASAQHKTEIRIVNNPMPFSKYFKNQIAGMQAISTGVSILLPFAFIPGNYVAFLVKERVSKAKHVQLVSGVKLTAYWTANFVWDLFAFLVSTTLSFIVFAMFNREEYIGSFDTVVGMLLLFFFYGLTAISASYLASFYFKKATTGQNVVLMVNFMSGFILVITVGVLEIIDSTKDVGKALRYVFRLVPAFCLGDGIVSMSQRISNNKMGISDSQPFDMDMLGFNILFLALMFPVYLAAALSHDFPDFWYRIGLKKRPRSADDVADEAVDAEDEDEDVVREREEVLAGRKSVVEVKRLRKVYPGSAGGPPKIAVRDVTFGVKPDEVFAFLGTNGAGKTTTISVLAGDFPPTSGSATVMGYDVVSEPREAKRELGYCPQFDALLDLLTPREHLEMYAGLRGIPEHKRERMVSSLMRVLGLEEHSKNVTKALSGGNKRKTSVAISMVGGPACILLDEPTAGMDPVARRGMWTALQTVGHGRSVILTTHHLEEVEALSHRTAIMVNGGIQCLGTLSHLKAKYGGSYEIQVKTTPEGEAAVRGFFASEFPAASLYEATNHRLTYKVGAEEKLSTMFGRVQAAKGNLGIVDYSISQTSLEQVFISICKKYLDEHSAQRHQEAEKEEQLKTMNIFKRSITGIKNSLS